MARQELPIGKMQGREGARWYNERPSSEDVAAWFEANVPMHDGMDPKNYIGGLTLISSFETPEEVRENDAGVRQFVKVRNQVHVPYCKVETRVKYFWDLMEKHPEWIGIIEPVDPIRKDVSDSFSAPPGFFYTSVPINETSRVTFVCASMRVRVIEREGAQWVSVGGRPGAKGTMTLQGKPVIDAPPATKQIAILTTGWSNNQKATVADPYAMMKAETGAVGRALGLAGMLVVPGTGVATAEDMLETQDGTVPQPGGAPSSPQLPDQDGEVPNSGDKTAELPVVKDPEVALREEAEAKLQRLSELSPEAHTALQTWFRDDRGFKSMGDLSASQLRGVVRKIDNETKKAEAEAVPAEAAPADAG